MVADLRNERSLAPLALTLLRLRVQDANRSASLIGIVGSAFVSAMLLLVTTSAPAAPWLLSVLGGSWFLIVLRYALYQPVIDADSDLRMLTRSARVFTVAAFAQAVVLGMAGPITLAMGSPVSQWAAYGCLVAAVAIAPGLLGSLPSVWASFNAGILLSAVGGALWVRPSATLHALPVLIPFLVAFTTLACTMHTRVRTRFAQEQRIGRLSDRLSSVRADARATNERLRESHAELSVLLENSSLAMLLIRQGDIVRASAAAGELFDLPVEDLSLPAIIARINRDNDSPIDGLVRSTLIGGRTARAEIRLVDERHRSRWYALICTPVAGHDAGHAIWTFFDQTDAVQGRTEANRRSETDLLTGLPNRSGLRRYIQALQKERGAAQAITLGFIDLNGFKSLNDRYGHAVGDAVLKSFGQRLGRCVGGSGCAARLGGDEFVIVLPAHAGFEMAHRMARRAIDAACAPVTLPGGRTDVRPAAALGLTDFNLAERGLDEALRVADQAMYQAKRDGRKRRPARSVPDEELTGQLF